MIERLVLEKFTAFEHLDIRFSPGINVFIGKNGTGKTHILKILYTAMAALHEKKRVSDKIAGVFMPRSYNIGRLVRRKVGVSKARVHIYKNGQPLILRFNTKTKETLKWSNKWNREPDIPVYIPAKEILTNAPGFAALYKQREIHFEEVFIDIITRAFLPKLRGPLSKGRKRLLLIIQRVMEGKVIEKEEEFYLKNKQGELEFSLLAEGLRKMGLLWLLIQNGSFQEGSALFWDEPEANLNPKIMGTVADILLELQRMGTQIFIATHDYVLLKEIELRTKTNDAVNFHSLFFDESGEISCKFSKSFTEIDPNAILEAFGDLYDLELERALGD
jgi:predicted ATPase